MKSEIIIGLSIGSGILLLFLSWALFCVKRRHNAMAHKYLPDDPNETFPSHYDDKDGHKGEEVAIDIEVVLEEAARKEKEKRRGIGYDGNSSIASSGSISTFRNGLKHSLDVHKCVSTSCEICRKRRDPKFNSINLGNEVSLEKATSKFTGGKLPKRWWEVEAVDEEKK